MSISYWQNSFFKQHQTLTYDFVILGAGIAGISTAYWLEKKHPNAKIAILDKNHVAAGASGKNAGFVTCGSAEHFDKLHQQFGIDKATEIWNFSEINRVLIQEEILHDDFSKVDFFQTGSTTVCPDQTQLERYQKILKDMTSQNLDVTWLSSEEVSDSYGVQSSPGAIEYKHDGIIHPVKLLHLIISKLKNTKIFENEEVFKIENLHSSVRIQSRSYQFEAAKLFLCLNGYLGQFDSQYKKLVQPQRGQVILTEKLPQFVKGPCYLTKHLCYFRQLPTGELLVGGFRNADLEAENTALDDITEKIQNALQEFTQSYFKNTRHIEIKYRWSGIMGFTKDGQMLIGQPTHLENTYLMAGCSGHGMGLSFHAAKVLAESAFGKPIPNHLSILRK